MDAFETIKVIGRGSYGSAVLVRAKAPVASSDNSGDHERGRLLVIKQISLSALELEHEEEAAKLAPQRSHSRHASSRDASHAAASSSVASAASVESLGVGVPSSRAAGVPQRARSLLNEVHILMRVGDGHPNICRYRSSFLTQVPHSATSREADPKKKQELLAICMDFYAGGDLSRRIKQRARQVSLENARSGVGGASAPAASMAAAAAAVFPEETVLDYMVQLCLGLAHCHRRRVLHRDLKASNVFISLEKPRSFHRASAQIARPQAAPLPPPPPLGAWAPHPARAPTEQVVEVLRIGDFGIARLLDSSGDLARTRIGTPYFLAPEVCEGRAYSSKADLWSLGCLDPSTRVWLADGTSARADELTPDSMLLGDDGRPVGIVANTLSGTVGPAFHFPQPVAGGHYQTPGAPPGMTTPCPGYLPMRSVRAVGSVFNDLVCSANHMLTVASHKAQADDGSGSGSGSGNALPGVDAAGAIRLDDIQVQQLEQLLASVEGSDGASGWSCELKLIAHSEPLVFPANNHVRSAVHLAMADAGLPTGLVHGVDYVAHAGGAQLMYRAAQFAFAMLNPGLVDPANVALRYILNPAQYQDPVHPRQAIYPPTAAELAAAEGNAAAAAAELIAQYIVEVSAWIVGLWVARGDGSTGRSISQSLQTQRGLDHGEVNDHSGIFQRCRHWADLLGLPAGHFNVVPMGDVAGVAAALPQSSITFSPPGLPGTAEDDILCHLLRRCGVFVDGTTASANKQRICIAGSAQYLGFQQAPVKTRLALLAGLIDGDGWRTASDEHSFCSQFRGLAEYACVLFRQTGVVAAPPVFSHCWSLHSVRAHYDHQRRLPIASWLKRTVGVGRRRENPFLADFRIHPHMAGAPQPVVSFQVANASQRFLLADGAITHNCLLYELLTGRHAFQASNLSTLVLAILRGDYSPISPVYSHRIQLLLFALLQKDPEKRPSALQLLSLPFMRERVPFWLSSRRIVEEFGVADLTVLPLFHIDLSGGALSSSRSHRDGAAAGSGSDDDDTLLRTPTPTEPASPLLPPPPKPRPNGPPSALARLHAASTSASAASWSRPHVQQSRHGSQHPSTPQLHSVASAGAHRLTFVQAASSDGLVSRAATTGFSAQTPTSGSTSSTTTTPSPLPVLQSRPLIMPPPPVSVARARSITRSPAPPLAHPSAPFPEDAPPSVLSAGGASLWALVEKAAGLTSLPVVSAAVAGPPGAPALSSAHLTHAALATSSAEPLQRVASSVSSFAWQLPFDLDFAPASLAFQCEQVRVHLERHIPLRTLHEAYRILTQRCDDGSSLSPRAGGSGALPLLPLAHAHLAPLLIQLCEAEQHQAHLAHASS